MSCIKFFCKNQKQHVLNNYSFPFHVSSLITRALLSVVLLLMSVIQLKAQTSNNEVIWNGEGYSLKKIVSNTSIASGVNFSYTIMFTAPAGASTVYIQDLVPTSLTVVSVPTPSLVCGVTPVVSIVGNTVTYSLSALPGACAAMGSFTIVVRFPEGTTCNGATARNQAGIRINDKWNYTGFVSTTATAVDPWISSKSILSGAVVNPSGGSCGYLMRPGDTVTYRISALKASGLWGNVVGQQNMSPAYITDVLPANAVLISATPNQGTTSFSGTTLSWTIGTLNAANAWAYYYCDIKVYYPAAFFPLSTTINNQVTLTGVTCQQQVSHPSNITCIQVANVTPVTSGYFQKYISLTNTVPGCQGYYTIAFCNTGNVNMSAFNINDVINSGINVTKIQVYGGSATTTMNLSANSGVNVINPLINGSWYDSGTLGFTTNNFQLSMTGQLPVGNCIYIYVYFTINPNPVGTVVPNCASFNGLANPLTLPNACVNFTVSQGTPNPCVFKEICSPKTSYDPGDTIRVRMRVQNIGSASITGASIQDVLNSNFTYLGNESYFVASTYAPACSSGPGIPSGTTAWSGVVPNHVGNTLNWNLPSIASDCQLFYVGYCGYYGTWGLPYYYIEFDVKVSNAALPGVTPNFFKIQGGNLSGATNSNTIFVLVVASFGQEATKYISTDNGTTFLNTATVAAGANARYRLAYKNTSNVPVTSVNLVDLLPRNDGANDWLVLNRSIPRGSQFDLSYLANHTSTVSPLISPPTRALTFAAGNNVCLPLYGISLGCTSSPFVASPTTRNMNVDYNTFIVPAGSTVREDFDIKVPTSATVNQTACNDFAAVSKASFLLNGIPQSVALTPIASPPVCLTVKQADPKCCDSVTVSFVQGTACCTKIKTTCEVKSIDVTVTNGILSSASWNCTSPIPTGYLNQSFFSFAGGVCNMELTTCVTATGGGMPMINYFINFANGERCERVLDLANCSPTLNCCDSLRITPILDATGAPTCCAKLTSKCPIDSVIVVLSNGTISSANWNCTTPIPSGYIGQDTFKFVGGTCLSELTICANPTVSGSVSLDFIAYYNGVKCVKSTKLNCLSTQSHCCDSVSVKQLLSATGAPLCCAEISTKCEVDSIKVSVSNGTLSNASWNCATPIPSAYLGLSSYTFVGPCVMTLKTCVDAIVSGSVTINYVVYFSNGEICQKEVKMDCKAPDPNCCDSVIIKAITNIEGQCCAQLTTTCNVDSIVSTISNGKYTGASWNCSQPMQNYIGQSSYTFAANGCVVDLVTCIKPLQSGSSNVNYVIYFSNGEHCEKSIKLDCTVPSTTCCALVTMNLSYKWPNINTLIGTFNITNIDPSSPICYVTISPSPAGTFSTGGLTVNGVPSAQSWNATRIPATGNLSPAATNSIKFNLYSTNYKGVITVCVVKCDGTRCCFDFKWNKNPFIDVSVGLGDKLPTGSLHAISVNPVINTPIEGNVKYVSFGLSDTREVETNAAEFFAISASMLEGSSYPTNIEAPSSAFMGSHNVFFELATPKASTEKLGAFNMVLKGILPKLGISLFDEDGNIIFAGNINISGNDTIITNIPLQGSLQPSMFEFINAYPNPNNGEFNITYATGADRLVEVHLINPLGQVIQKIDGEKVKAGIHKTSVGTYSLPKGMYKVLIMSKDKVLSKSVLIN